MMLTAISSKTVRSIIIYTNKSKLNEHKLQISKFYLHVNGSVFAFFFVGLLFMQGLVAVQAAGAYLTFLGATLQLSVHPLTHFLRGKNGTFVQWRRGWKGRPQSFLSGGGSFSVGRISVVLPHDRHSSTGVVRGSQKDRFSSPKIQMNESQKEK